MPEFRRGFVTQIGMDLITALEHGGTYGFDFVEIFMDGPGHRNELAAERDELLSAADAADIDLSVHLPFKLDIASPYTQVREGALRELDACLRAASDLDVEKAVVHAQSNAWSAAWRREDIQPLLLDAVRELDDAANQHDIELCVENIPGGFFDTWDFDILFEETGAAMTLDTGHARIDGMESRDMADFLEAHHDRVSHLHLNDTRIPEDEHVPFGAGTIDFDRLFEPLQANDWTGTLSLEVFTQDYDYIGKSLDRLDALLP